MRKNLSKLLFAGAIVGLLAAATISPAFAAKGVITEVNPSGVGFSIRINIDPDRGGKNVARVSTPGRADYFPDIGVSLGQ
ncbi:MAG: hypothetical protein QF898_06270 [SAR202 cluster bacterium]|jgi:hypothetical protein|nr:hypothetical protein [SAR202 cluster bacterium]MDP6514351.1 hypothetical protein [SAR202 cluster bacterium]